MEGVYCMEGCCMGSVAWGCCMGDLLHGCVFCTGGVALGVCMGAVARGRERSYMGNVALRCWYCTKGGVAQGCYTGDSVWGCCTGSPSSGSVHILFICARCYSVVVLHGEWQHIPFIRGFLNSRIQGPLSHIWYSLQRGFLNPFDSWLNSESHFIILYAATKF